MWNGGRENKGKKKGEKNRIDYDSCSEYVPTLSSCAQETRSRPETEFVRFYFDKKAEERRNFRCLFSTNFCQSLLQWIVIGTTVRIMLKSNTRLSLTVFSSAGYRFFIIVRVYNRPRKSPFIGYYDRALHRAHFYLLYDIAYIIRYTSGSGS